MIRLGITDTRMKDFYDLLILAHEFAFDGPTLAAAIRATFTRRGAAIPKSAPLALTAEFANDAAKQTEWQGFLQRSRFEVDALTLTLPTVTKELQTFLLPPTAALATGTEFVSRWMPSGPWDLLNSPSA